MSQESGEKTNLLLSSPYCQKQAERDSKIPELSSLTSSSTDLRSWTPTSPQEGVYLIQQG